MRVKTVTKWDTELRKNRTDMAIRAKENWGIKNTPTNMPDSNDKETYKNRIEKYRWGRGEKRILKIFEDS